MAGQLVPILIPLGAGLGIGTGWLLSLAGLPVQPCLIAGGLTGTCGAVLAMALHEGIWR